MKLSYISEKEFDDFAYKQERSNFTQSAGWAAVNRKRNFKTHFLALKDEKDTIKAAALLLEKKIICYSSFYCPRSFLADYHDKVIIKEMLTALKTFVKENKGLYLRLDPDLIIRKYDEEGKVKAINQEYYDLIDFFKENGGTYKGFTTNFADTAAPRFTFRIDVAKSNEELLNSFHSRTRLTLKADNPYRLIITKNKDQDLINFYEVMKQTSIRKQLYCEPKAFFDNFYHTLHQYEMSDVFVAKANVADLKKAYAEKEAQLNDLYELCYKRPDNPKKENKLKELDKKKVKLQKEKSQIDMIEKEELILSAIITARFKDKVWLIHGGNSDDYGFLNANYELYYHIIKDSRDNGYQIVDFYGSEGIINKQSPLYGIYLFKQHFGADLTEFIGEFDFIVRPLANFFIQKLISLRRRYLYNKSLRKAKNENN